MKILLLCFLTAYTALPITAQTIEGTYANKWEAVSGEAIEYSLTLLEDGDFIFVSTRTYSEDIPNRTVNAKGKWSLKGHVLNLYTTSGENIENNLESNLNRNKAKFISVSPRNPNFNLVKPSLKFYESDVFYAKDMELVKTETNMTAY